MKMTCHKHGDYEDDSWDKGSCGDWPNCPRCKYISENSLCQDCEEHKASIKFSEGAIAYIHGMIEKICKCCYLKRCRVAEKGIKETIDKLVAETSVTPCT